jgi:hypothetical protein
MAGLPARPRPPPRSHRRSGAAPPARPDRPAAGSRESAGAATRRSKPLRSARLEPDAAMAVVSRAPSRLTSSPQARATPRAPASARPATPSPAAGRPVRARRCPLPPAGPGRMPGCRTSRRSFGRRRGEPHVRDGVRGFLGRDLQLWCRRRGRREQIGGGQHRLVLIRLLAEEGAAVVDLPQVRQQPGSADADQDDGAAAARRRAGESAGDDQEDQDRRRVEVAGRLGLPSRRARSPPRSAVAAHGSRSAARSWSRERG